jgi:SAM-dependent methyltransferase
MHPYELRSTADVEQSLNRDQFTERILKSKKDLILEIGPLNRPLITGHFMKYFDLLPTEKLKIRAVDQGLDPISVPPIDFHDENGDLSVIADTFNDVISAHCLEHQPDLVRHLQNVSRILKSTSGRYWIVLPDKRYCFDALIPETSLTGIVEAFDKHLTKPSIWKVIEHRALTTHNDPVEHWNGNHGDPDTNLKSRWDAAKKEFEDSDGAYIDVHCWQFTPQSFVNIINGLLKLGYIDFEVEEIFDTPTNDLEFCAILKKR